MEPEPTIICAFSLVVRELDERTRTAIPSTIFSNFGIFVVALMVKSSSSSPNSSQNFTSMKKKENLYVPIAVSYHGSLLRTPWLFIWSSFSKSSPTDSQKTESSMDYLSSLTNEQCQGLRNMLQLYLNKAKFDATRSNKAK